MKRVYFVRPIGMTGPVKVGCSKVPEGRLKALDIWSPFPLEIIASADGEFADERNVHWHLRDDRLHGEWFSWSPKLARLITYVTERGPLPPLEKSPYGKTGMGRGKNPNRDKDLSRAKCALSRRIRSAELHAWGRWDRHKMRPAWVNDLQKAWNGPFTPLLDEAVAQAEDYISVLLCFPKCTKTWREHHAEWRAQQGLAA